MLREDGKSDWNLVHGEWSWQGTKDLHWHLSDLQPGDDESQGETSRNTSKVD